MMSSSKSKGIKGTLSGKIALISGGSSGIGRATALLFAREGATVSIIDLDQAGGQDVVQSIIDSAGISLRSL